MNTITVSIVLPVELYAKWTRRVGDNHVSLNEAVVKCLLRHHQMSDTAGSSQSNVNAALPQRLNPQWGQAWSRRWDDLAARKFSDSQPGAPSDEIPDPGKPDGSGDT